MIEIRKLAAIDIALLGRKIITAEFLLGVLGPAALGIFIALRSKTMSQLLLAAYFLSLALNYVPLFLYARAIGRAGTAELEIGAELARDKRGAMRRYRRGSLLLLLPLVVPIAAIRQEQSRRRGSSVS